MLAGVEGVVGNKLVDGLVGIGRFMGSLFKAGVIDTFLVWLLKNRKDSFIESTGRSLQSHIVPCPGQPHVDPELK